MILLRNWQPVKFHPASDPEGDEKENLDKSPTSHIVIHDYRKDALLFQYLP